MYKFKVLTVRDLDFLDDNKRPVKGQQLWVLGESADPQWNGWEVVKIWIPDGHKLESIVSHLQLGDMIKVQFDRRGKPESIEKLDS